MSHEAAAYGNGYQYPDGWQTNGAAHHMRVNEVAFQLLQYQKQHDERQCLHGADHENQECSYHAADECPENGDQCCEGDEDAYQQGIREAQKCHGNKEHGTKNDGFQTLSGEELGKCAQGGSFELYIDGDLFKAEIGFPIVPGRSGKVLQNEEDTI